MKFLVTGSGGQLAMEFIRRLEARGDDFLAPDESRCDITDQTAVEQVVASFRPDCILNCAAYNLVDKAETEREAAFRVNARGPKNLAEAAERHGARLVHFGSDYVFDGAKEDGLYEEGDPPRPLNQYGSSKRTGEQAVLDVLQGRALVLRLSWVFGEGKQNFVHKFLERVGRNLPLAVTYDEFSVPTWTGTIAEAALEAVEQGLTGLFHLTSTGYCSRFEWARLILKARGAERFIRPVSMDSLRLPARRPTFSAMSSALIARQLRMTIPPWEEAVSRFLEGRHDP